MEIVVTCPGCGLLIEQGFEGALTVSEVDWQRVSDGRYVGTVMVEWNGVAYLKVVNMLGVKFPDAPLVIHECAFGGGGGSSGDREPIHPSPPPRATKAEADPATN